MRSAALFLTRRLEQIERHAPLLVDRHPHGKRRREVRLERAGVQVIYGIANLKTHCKTILVVRRDFNGLRRYAHIGTGNYHSGTARLYSDLGMLTCDDEIAQDLTELFNVMTGYGTQRDYRRLITAPDEFRPAILERIAAETAAPDGRIRMKMNSLIDEEMIEALYAASAAGTACEASGAALVTGAAATSVAVTGATAGVVSAAVSGNLASGRRSSSGRKWRMRPWIGHAAASPRAQMVWPSTCLVTCCSMSISSIAASPSRRRSIMRHIQPVPSRQGVHWPQLSCL